jgi:hypothetical protein
MTAAHATLVTMIRDEADQIEAGLKLQAALQAQSLELLRAELHALARLIPGSGPGSDPWEPRKPATEAEIEALFDNMPV